MSAPPTDPAPFPWLRAVVFALLTVAMSAGAVNNLVLRNPWHPWFKPWRMYFAFGTDLCEVEYVQVAADGRERVLDRYAVLGHPDWRSAPPDLRNLPDGPTIGRVAHRLCEVLPTRKPDVRARARCATVAGWKPVPELDRNLCELGRRQIEGLRPKARR